MSFVCKFYLYNPNYDYLFALSLIPLALSIYILIKKKISLIFENIVLSILCGVLPFLFIQTIVLKAFAPVTGDAKEAMYNFTLAENINLLIITQLVTVLTVVIGIYLKIKDKSQ